MRRRIKVPALKPTHPSIPPTPVARNAVQTAGVPPRVPLPMLRTPFALQLSPQPLLHAFVLHGPDRPEVGESWHHWSAGLPLRRNDAIRFPSVPPRRGRAQVEASA